MNQRQIASPRGFTLIELIVVMALLALALSMVLPNIKGSVQNLQMNSVLRDLEKKIRYIQYRSVMEGKRYALRYDRVENSYQFFRENRSQDHVDWIPIEGRWGHPQKIPRDMNLWFRGKEKIYFLPNGEISEGNLVLRADSETLATLRLGDSLRGVEVERK